MVRIVLAELIDEGAGKDRAVAAVRAFNGAAFDVGLMTDAENPYGRRGERSGTWPTRQNPLP